VFVLPRRESNDERQLNAARTSFNRKGIVNLLSTVQTLKKETKVLKRKFESYREINDRYTREVNKLDYFTKTARPTLDGRVLFT
jgi:predicted RNase H-like nuclease (RuvC/YqgF family)